MGWKITKREKPNEGQKISWVTDAGHVVDGIFTQGRFWALLDGVEVEIDYIPDYWISGWSK